MKDKFVLSQGSRKMFGKNYVKENEKVPGAPFPNNLRAYRRNRPHSKTSHKPPSQSYNPTPEDLEARNPVIMTTTVKDANLFDATLGCDDEQIQAHEHILSAGHKSLLRKGAKFCPTPTHPIDDHAYYQGFLRFQESVRWAYFHAKQNNFQPTEDTFTAPTWYQRTDKAAPEASKAVEAFLEG